MSNFVQRSIVAQTTPTAAPTSPSPSLSPTAHCTMQKDHQLDCRPNPLVQNPSSPAPAPPPRQEVVSRLLSFSTMSNFVQRSITAQTTPTAVPISAHLKNAAGLKIANWVADRRNRQYHRIDPVLLKAGKEFRVLIHQERQAAKRMIAKLKERHVRLNQFNLVQQQRQEAARFLQRKIRKNTERKLRVVDLHIVEEAQTTLEMMAQALNTAESHEAQLKEALCMSEATANQHHNKWKEATQENIQLKAMHVQMATTKTTAPVTVQPHSDTAGQAIAEDHRDRMKTLQMELKKQIDATAQVEKKWNHCKKENKERQQAHRDAIKKQVDATAQMEKKWNHCKKEIKECQLKWSSAQSDLAQMKKESKSKYDALEKKSTGALQRLQKESAVQVDTMAKTIESLTIRVATNAASRVQEETTWVKRNAEHQTIVLALKQSKATLENELRTAKASVTSMEQLLLPSQQKTTALQKQIGKLQAAMTNTTLPSAVIQKTTGTSMEVPCRNSSNAAAPSTTNNIVSIEQVSRIMMASWFVYSGVHRCFRWDKYLTYMNVNKEESFSFPMHSCLLMVLTMLLICGSVVLAVGNEKQGAGMCMVYLIVHGMLSPFHSLHVAKAVSLVGTMLYIYSTN